MKTDLVSIIIPTRNGLEYLKQVVDSLETIDSGWPFEVIIVDNASEDGTREYVTTSDLKIDGQFIYNDKNEGFAKANNQAALVAKGNFLCLLNNDTIPTEGWLGKMMSVFSEEDAVGVVGARLVHPGKGTIQHAGVVELSSGMPDHIHFNRPMNHPDVMKRKQYFGVTGACMVTPKSLYEELGGLDESYVNGWEDMDYMKKVNHAGHRVYYEPEALVYHYESRTKERYRNESRNYTLYMTTWIYSSTMSEV